MRAFLLAAFLLLVNAGSSAAQSAQNSRVGINGGFALGSQSNAYSQYDAQNSGGWNLGLSMIPVAPASPLTMRVDLGYSALPNVQYSVSPPNPLALSVQTDYQIYGATANALWRVFGVQHAVVPYLVGGIGWYAVHSESRLTALPPGSSGSAIGSTVGAIGFDYGLGLKISHVALEARAQQIQNVNTPNGKKTLYMVPITLGIWF